MKDTIKRFVKNNFKYDPDTGHIYRKNEDGYWENCLTLGGNGRGKTYYYVNFDYKKHVATKVIWILVYGRLPKGRIYFKDGNPMNLKLNNLIELPFNNSKSTV